MARTKRENTWKPLSIQIDEKLYDQLKAEAESESRTLTATVEVILRERYAEKLKVK